tara:strand:- start:3774 stop:4130 length:357 start_codon:yes stop_codon:yes gene_type:complete
MSGARANAAAIARRANPGSSKSTISKTDPTSLPEGQRKITIPVGQALNIMQNSILELKNKESTEDNSFFMSELTIVNEKIAEITNENTCLKKEIEALKKTITDIQTLSNAMNTKLMTL